MESNQNHCIYCERTNDAVPLISIEFKGQALKICSQHLPILIHNPSELIDKLPGAEDLNASDHVD